MSDKCKEMYEKLAQEHQLPEFDLINQEFEIEDLDKSTFLLRNLRRHITKRVEVYLDLVTEVISPEGHLAAMMESSQYSEKDLEPANELFKQLNQYMRESQYIATCNDDKKNAVFTLELTQVWPKIRQKLQLILQQRAEFWKKEFSENKDNGYFG